MLNFKKIRCKVGLLLVLIFSISSLAFAKPFHKDVFKEVSADQIYQHIAVLASKDNARITGFEGEHEAANYIAEEFRSYGLKVDRQRFPVLSFLDKGVELSVITPEQKTLDAKNFSFTPPTSKEGITAELVFANLGMDEDFQDIDVDGKIALVQRGGLTFFEKAQNAADAGAVGVIIFNNTEGVISGTLGEPSDIPAIAITQQDGEYLKALLETGEKVNLKMVVNTEVKNSFSQNIIGTLPAQRRAKKAETIVIGAHYDSVDTPGANDNASGTATMMEIARVLSKEKLAYNIKFIAFGAEEIGLVGSYNYVSSLEEKELYNIVAMINLDMVGVGDTIGVMTARKDAKSFVADLAEDYVKTFGHSYERKTSSASDHVPFEEAEIPVVFLNYGPDPYYHTKEDSLDKIQKNNLYNMCTLVTTLTYDMAKTPMPQSIKGLRSKVNKYKGINPEFNIK